MGNTARQQRHIAFPPGQLADVIVQPRNRPEAELRASGTHHWSYLQDCPKTPSPLLPPGGESPQSIQLRMLLVNIDRIHGRVTSSNKWHF